MNTAALSLDQSPPLSVPAPYFAVAPWFLVAAGLLLTFHPTALSDRWSAGALALTHLVTLGFVAMIMIGAFQQLLPVLAAAPVSWPRMTAMTIFIPLCAGAGLLPLGFIVQKRALLILALLLLAFAMATFVLAGAWALMRARSAHATVSAMAAALAALLVTLGLGLYLGSGHASSVVLARDLTPLHVGWGLLGWVGLLLIGVAYEVVPMFQVTPAYPTWMVRGLVPALFVTLLLWSAAMVAFPALLPGLITVLAAGVALFAATTLALQCRRRRRLADVTVDFWRLAMFALLAVVLISSGSAWLGRPAPEVLLGVIFLFGFAVSVISGMSYKIVPFLVWLHLNNRTFGSAKPCAPVPNMKQVIPERRSRWHYRVHVAALMLLVLAVVADSEAITRIAGVMLAAAAALLAGNLANGFRLYLSRLGELHEGSR